MKKLLLLLLLFASPSYGALYHYFEFARDNTGAALTSATIEVDKAGTSSPASLFSDIGGTAPLANPVTADGTTGFYDFYIEPGLYKIIVTKVSYTYTIDNILMGTLASEQLRSMVLEFPSDFNGQSIGKFYISKSAQITTLAAQLSGTGSCTINVFNGTINALNTNMTLTNTGSVANPIDHPLISASTYLSIPIVSCSQGVTELTVTVAIQYFSAQ